MYKIFLVVFAAFFHFSANAQTAPTYEYEEPSCVILGQRPTAWSEKNLATWLAASPSYAGSYLSVPGHFSGTSTIYCTGTIARMFNGAPNGSGGMSTQAICNVAQGWAIDPPSKTCRRIYVPPTCPAGQTRSKTWSVGWSATATPTGSEPLVTPPSQYCDGSCLAMIATVDAAGVDTSPSANGSFEMTADVTYSTTGQTCTDQTPQPPVPDPPPPADGGGDGDGTGDGDPNGDPDPDVDPGDGPADPNDSDGDGIPDSEEPGDAGSDGGSSSVTCTLTQQELGACSCTTEQQAAGSCSTGPATGSCTREQSIAGLCSCTTPTGEATTCSGGSGGGDPNAPDTGSEAVCGGPGLPACTVQILEAQAYDGGKYVDKISEVAKTIENAIDNDSTYWNKVKTYLSKTAAELTGWTWTFTLPTGCTPFVMAGYGLSIDVCQFQPMIHDIMGLLWSLATIGFLIRLFLWGID